MAHVPVKAVSVFLWGRRVGVLVHAYDQYTRFEYDADFRRSGIEIAPFAMPLNRSIYTSDEFELTRRAFHGLPGVFADSLPDSFGNRLVDKWMADHGITRRDVTPLDRLAYVGSRGMGALTYEPEINPGGRIPSVIDMRRLAGEARCALNADLSALKGDDALREIIRVGTSAGGAQAKAVVGWSRRTNEFLAGTESLPEGFEHWLVKFSPPGDGNAGRDEFETCESARRAGIDMSESVPYELDGAVHFLTRRFDREGDVRHLTQTYCAMRHLPAGSPRGLLTYEGLFDTAIALGMGYDALEQLYRRMCFNVLNRETDDHTKNFSFLMRRGGRWELAPAYDLTGFHVSAGEASWNEWSNQHALSVNSKFSSITDSDMLRVGERYGIGTREDVLAEVRDAVSGGTGNRGNGSDWRGRLPKFS